MSELESVPVVPIHSAPKTSPRKARKQRPTVDRIADHTAVSSDPATGTPPTEMPKRRSHALDAAANGTKIVVVELGKVRRAVLGGPDGAKQLPDGDIAHTLPIGAKITKREDGQFVSTQLNPSILYPDTVHATAMDAITAFVPYFHRA